MRKMSFIAVMLFVFVITISASEWLSFSDSDGTEPIFDVSSSTSALVELNIEIPGMNSDAIESYNRINIPGHSRSDSTSFPEVPVVIYLIAIPECDNVNLNITLLDSIVIENMNIYPAPELVEVNNGEYTYLEEQFTINSTFYNSNEFFPESQADLIEKGAVRDQHCIRLNIFPVKFNPALQQVIAYSQLNIEMTFDNAIGSVNEDVGIFNEVCSGAMINYVSNGMNASINCDSNRDAEPVKWVEVFSDGPDGKYIEESCDYLIVTHFEFWENSDLQALADKRREYNGFDIVIVKMDDIENQIIDPLLNPDDKMKLLIKNTYEQELANSTFDNKLGYVLLFGDVELESGALYPVPTHDNGYDIYFSQLTETSGVPDVYPDVFIGRLPVDNEEQVANVCTKIVNYEPINVNDPNYDNWKDRMTFLGGQAWGSITNGLNAIAPLVENYVTTVLTDGEHSFPNFNHNLFYDETNLLTKYDEGNLIVTYMGHGSTQNWGWPGSPQPTIYHFYYDDIDNDQYNGRLPLIFSMSCNTGAFQDEDDCMAEKFLVSNSNRGSIGFIGASEDSDSYSFHEFAPHLFEAFSRNLTMCGEMLMEAKLKTSQDFYRYHFNLLGDPALNIFLDSVNIGIGDLQCSSQQINTEIVNNQTLQVTAGISNLSSVNVSGNIVVECQLTNNLTNNIQTNVYVTNNISSMETKGATFNFNISDCMPTQFDILITVDPDNIITERNEDNNEADSEYSYYQYQDNFPAVVPLSTTSFDDEDIPLYSDNSIILGGKKISDDGNMVWNNGMNTEGLSLPVYNPTSDITDYIMRDDETDHLYRINGNNGSTLVHYDTGIYNVFENYCLGDITNDGVLELIVACKYQSNRKVMIFDLDGSFLTEQQISDNITDIAAGDSNNNGKLELFILYGYANPTISIFEMNNGQLTEINQINVTGSPQRIVLEDFNNNGYIDIALFLYNSISFWDCSNYAQYSEFTLSSSYYSESIGDMDNDGISEIIILQMGNSFDEISVNQIDVFENQYNFLFSVQDMEPMQSNVKLVDLDSDHYLDIIIQATIGNFVDNNSIKGFSSTGDPLFSITNDDSKTYNIIADVDSDGDIEIIFGEEAPEFGQYTNYKISISDLNIPVGNSGNIYPKMNKLNNNLYSQPVTGLLSENTDYYWSGTITLYNEVILPATSSINISSGTIIKAKENSKLTTYGDLIVNGTENQPVKFEPIIQGASQNYWQGLEFPEGNAEAELNHVLIQNANLSSERDITINGGSLINTPLLQDRQSLWLTDVDFDNSPITAELYGITQLEIVSINNCHIFNSPMNSGVEITGYPNISISYNVIENCNSGLKLWESGSGIINTISNNIIRNNNQNYGVFLYHSNIDILGYNRIENNRDGLFIIRDSNFNLIGSEDYPLQIIRNNGEHEIRFTYDSRPGQFYYNKIYDENHEYSYVKCERIPLFNEPIDVSNNNWGTSFNPNTDLSPFELFTYLPMWDPGIPRNPDTTADEEMYLSAQQSINNEDYTEADQTFKQIIAIYPESKYAKIAAKELLDLKVKSDQDFAGLKLYYETEPNMQYDEEMTKLAEFLINCCNIKLEEFQPAIDFYEEIIQNPPSTVDSVFAVIDAGYTYLVMENSGRGQCVGEISELKPESRKQYDEKRDDLMHMLFGNSEPDNEIPPIHKLALYPNYPNPFNPSTTISFSLPKESKIELSVYNIKGQKVKTLVKDEFESGKHSVIWFGKDNNNKKCSSGIYFYQFKVNGKSKSVKKCLLLK